MTRALLSPVTRRNAATAADEGDEHGHDSVALPSHRSRRVTPLGRARLMRRSNSAGQGLWSAVLERCAELLALEQRLQHELVVAELRRDAGDLHDLAESAGVADEVHRERLAVDDDVDQAGERAAQLLDRVVDGLLRRDGQRVHGFGRARNCVRK